MAEPSNGVPHRDDSSGGKGPGMFNSAVVVAILILVATLALTVRQPPPPSIAEFAPQAREQITEAPEEQAGTLGSGSGTGEGSSGGASPSPSPSPVDVPRVKRCIGDPPRQTEDPQSPPCVPYWDGDNGGATTRGVTRDEIRVALPLVAFEDHEAIKLLAGHFNRRYQFYGRKIVLQAFRPQGDLVSYPNPSRDQADAVYVDEELQSFASLATGLRWGAEHHYYDELARREIISIAHGTGALATESNYRSFAPYKWSTMASMDTIQRNLAEFICKVLANKPPIYAGPPQNGSSKRVFGLLYQRTQEGTAPDLRPLLVGLEGCGATPIETVEDRPSSDPARNGENQMLQMSTAGVTSVICLCNVGDARAVLMPAASSQGYYPEWIATSYIGHDVDNGHRQSPPNQASGVIGISFKNKWLLREDMPWYWAVKESNQNYGVAEGSYYHLASRYASMLLLASGIQLAGPDLTPESFQRGLWEAQFPNPGAGGPPYYQARVGFPGGRHTMTDDAAMFWYSTNSQSVAEPSLVGAACSAKRGVRYSLGRWPSENPSFREGSCL